jgi:hypothetical protein
MSFSLSIALALATALGGSSASVTAMQQPMPQPQTVEQYVRDYFVDEPVMAEIASCESHFKQFGADGQVVKNPKSSAVGIFQIMSSIHSTFADEKLGLDIYTIQGNLAYAKYLYSKDGTAPWNASKSCWGKSDAATALAIK